MKCEIIAVGNEVVTGHVINTNAGFIASTLQTIGIETAYHSAVKDEATSIIEALNAALGRASLIVLTGGLGPTKDDLTKEAVCQALGLECVENEEELAKLKTYFEKSHQSMPENNKKQVLFPKEAYVLKNNYGTAPGCVIALKDKQIVLLPGPPKELVPMVKDMLLPYLKKEVALTSETLDIKIFGISESALAEKLDNLLGEYPWGSIATYVGNYEIIIRITVFGENQQEVSEHIGQAKEKIENCLGSFIIGYNEEKLEENVLKQLEKHHYTVTTVESCTGGLVAATLINCSGASTHFNEGIITYSNEAKMKYADVQQATLAAYGAVSEQTAKEMAEGIRKRAGADIGLSTTGIAGPLGGTQEKPVGLVYIGLALPEATYVYKLQLNGTREDIRQKTVKNILFKLYQKLN